MEGDVFTEDLHSTNGVADILSFACLTPYIGNRRKDEVNFNNIYNTVTAHVDVSERSRKRVKESPLEKGGFILTTVIRFKNR